MGYRCEMAKNPNMQEKYYAVWYILPKKCARCKGAVFVTIREELEAREEQWLAPCAARSANTRGREKTIDEDTMRTEFQRDRDRILHSKSFRRLKHKTQCFLSPEGDHYRTRLTHTLEVAQIARTLARSLRLNEDLAEAIALGHDLGHTPFGHMGERVLDRLMHDGFKHREQSLRVVTKLEREGEGLNLTWEVRDGILHHSGAQAPATLEGQCVSRADRIAYLNHDIDDALRAGVLKPADLPREAIRVLGETTGQRINTMVADIVQESADGQGLRMSEAVGDASTALRAFMFERVYMRYWVVNEERKASRMLEMLFSYYMEHPDCMPNDYIERAYTEGMERSVADFVAGMTDRYAMQSFRQLFLPDAFEKE